MDSKALLMMMVFGIVYCKQGDVLFDSTKETKLGWDKFQGGAGEGWMEKDYRRGESWTKVYSVCDIDQTNPENWVTSPMFDVKGADAIWIEVNYAVSNCKDEDGCRFDVKSFESKSVPGAPMYVTWNPVYAVNTSKSESDTSIQTGVIRMPVSMKNKENKISIGFEDHGSGCTTILSFKAYLVVCDQMTTTWVTFPKVSVLAADREVKGECMENAKVKSEPLSVCNKDGEWENTRGECECDDSFELKDGTCIAVSAASRIESLTLLTVAAALLFTRL